MGYILPIESYQQMNYQLRQPTTARNVESVARPFRSMFEREYEQIYSQHERIVKGSQTSPTDPKINNQSIANIVGKGINFDRAV